MKIKSLKLTASVLATLTVGLLASSVAPARAATNGKLNDLDAKIVQLSKQGSRAEDVPRLLGEPERYLWGEKTFTKETLPDIYLMEYPQGVQVLINGGLVRELRSKEPGPGFTWRGKLRLGSSLEEVEQVVGPPAKTVAGKPLDFKDGVLYQDIDGKQGRGYYARPDQNVRFFLRANKIAALYVTLDGQDAPARYSTSVFPGSSLTIVRRPEPSDFGRGRLGGLPAYDPKAADNPWQVDLRGYDLSHLDVANRTADLLHADFDSKTRWPARLPSGFEPARLMELGQDPGLGVRQLHAKGVTGKGIGLGIIDQTLLTGHAEYGSRLRLYEELHNPQNSAQMHGPAVASIAVGQTVGVAPEADLYYIAETHGTSGGGGRFDWDFTYLAKAIDRMLEVSASLPKEKRIRVISISVGWAPSQKGYAEVTASVERAKRAWVFVISTALEKTHGLAFHGLGRQPLADPDMAASYGPRAWWAADFFRGPGRFAPGTRLLVPMDARGVASPTGDKDYVFYADGGWSWAVPWLAGLYTLACQVNPDITPEQFWAAALKTGQTITLRHDGADIRFGTIANPAALIANLQPGRPL